MIKTNITCYFIMAVLILSSSSLISNNAFAASVDLGTSNTFGILSGTYANSAAGVVITGDLGYTIAPATNPDTLSGQTYIGGGVGNAAYQQAGADQATAKSTLDNMPCTPAFTFGAATVLSDLPQPLKSGVYCITGAMSIGTGGITLNETGVYVFRSTGALNTLGSSTVTLTNGADASNVFWTPTATTLGTNSVFVGTDIDNSGITISDGVIWLGRALDFATTVSTGANVHITVPSVTPSVTLTGIAITHPANQTNYAVGEQLNLAGLVVNATYSDSSTHVVPITFGNVTGFDSSSPVNNQVLTITVGSQTAPYQINVIGFSSVPIDLGQSSSYVILSGSVITNGVPSQQVTGNTGHISTLTHDFTYVGSPLGTDHIGQGPLGTLQSHGTPLGDEHAALGVIGTYIGTTDTGLACTFTFPPGAIDLSTDTRRTPIGVYTPGVYCMEGAPSIGTAGITLNGVGTYVFKSHGILTSVDGSQVRLTNGAQTSDVFWAPIGGASLGANSNFTGTILAGSAGITLGADSDLDQGRFISESAVTILGGAHTITIPGGTGALPPIRINQGTSGSFAVLGSTTVTNTGNTVVTGDLGLSPGSSITGFFGTTANEGPGIVIGTVHQTDTAAHYAQLNATAEYNALASQTCTTNEPPVADIGGQTLTPGVYCFPSSAAITGTLTLNGSGVYIFKTVSTLITAAGPGASSIVLTNGASASNIFWQVGSSATLGTSSVFKGTIIALTSVAATNSASVDGRLIALNGAVTLDTNQITAPPTPDVTDPTVSITSPSGGSVINQDHFAISGTAHDDVSVANVAVTVDGNTVTVSGTNNWSTSATGLSDGVHEIIATSSDAAGNHASQTIHVIVNTVTLNTSTTSIASATGAGSITSATDAGVFTSFTPLSESTLSTVGKPSAETFPYGFFSFNVTSLTLGQTIHVTQTYPAPIPANAQYWKVENGVWTNATSLISISGNTLTLTITDDGLGDADGLQNGMISDPSGIGVPPPINLGTATTFGILASTYTNTVSGTTINGDLGYTIGPAVNPVIFGTTHIADSTYSQAGTDQNSALIVLNNMACTDNLGTAVDLSNAHIGGVYTPGVYCSTGAMSTGTGITLNGAGTYVFRADGALDITVNSDVTLTNGANAFNVFWTPTAATTFEANSNFAGTDIDPSGATIGSTVSITGRILAFGGVVSTDTDTISVPSPPVAPLNFQMPSGSNSPSESRPSLGGVLLQTFSDGLRINGHVFDVSKFHNPVPQQVLSLDKPVSITIKQGLSRGSQTWQHVMLFMNFGGKDTTTGNADTWMSLDKHDGVQVNDPNGFVTNVGIQNNFEAYNMNTTFTFTPVKQMTDSNMIIRVWDDRLSQTDANVDGAIVFGTVPLVAAPMVKPDWIQVFTTMTDADNVIENAGFVKPALFSHISTTGQVWAQPNTGHILWFYDTKDLQVARVIYDSNGNVMGETVEPLINSTSVVDAKDMSYSGNHLNRQNDDQMKQALAQQAANAAQTIEKLGYNR